MRDYGKIERERVKYMSSSKQKESQENVGGMESIVQIAVLFIR